MRGSRAAALSTLVALTLGVSSAVATAQDGGGYEEFEEVDPYTRGERELMDRLGYVSFGPFPWHKGDDTAAVQLNMGAVPMLWVETPHFCIGTSLGTYTIPGDRTEREKLKDEIGRLRKKLGKLKAPKKKLDPWLRLHIYAQRVEELYSAFHEDFGISETDYAESGPHLGQSSKLRLLLCERTSEYSRHGSVYLDIQNDTSFRFGWSGIGMGFATNLERLKGRWVGMKDIPFDTVLYCTVASALGQVFIDAYRQCDYGGPEWLKRGYGHVLWRRHDDRYVNDAGYEPGQNIGEDDHEWERRVHNLVGNDFYAGLADMFGWQSGAMNKRDHMVSWSKVSYLLEQVEGDHRRFLNAVCQKTPEGTPAEALEKRTATQNRALLECFEVLPKDFDKAWARWVKKTYD